MGGHQARLKREKELLAATPWPTAACHQWGEEPEDEERERGLSGLLAALSARLERGMPGTSSLELLLFGLRHLFHQLATLYQRRLPALGAATRPLMDGLVPPDYLPTRHAIWLALREVNDSLLQCDLSCRLLTSASGTLLDLLDRGSASDPTTLTSALPPLPSIASVPPAGCCPLWLRQLLANWQEGYQHLPPFALQFGRPGSLPGAVALAGSTRLDRAFALLLEEAGAIFGELLPGLTQQKECTAPELALFLIDITQHGEQMLLTLDGLWEPLSAICEAFGVEALLSPPQAKENEQRKSVRGSSEAGAK
ncbi:hypothetical protein [Thermogemmatispora onikobensis]|uniref:hypothetical protein n=1 Tax=Thermogemmatispora onikobensis TaxID=732234 RepID=UPI000853CDC9|nr:hypothetical protein [Thermogemmatispora onikobensis]